MNATPTPEVVAKALLGEAEDELMQAHALLTTCSRAVTHPEGGPEPAAIASVIGNASDLVSAATDKVEEVLLRFVKGAA